MKHFILFSILCLLVACGDSGSGVYEEDDTSDTDSIGVDGTDSGDTDSTGIDDTSGPDPWDVNCEEVACPQEPPPDECNLAGQLVTYSGAPDCVDRVCQYQGSVSDCDWACDYDNEGVAYCKDYPCDGVVCDDPPDAECVEMPFSTPEFPDYAIPSLGIANHSSGGYLLAYLEDAGSCNENTGECEYSQYKVEFTFCGDVNGCVIVSNDHDYCDTEVHTPCQETGCWWQPTINERSDNVCVGYAEGFDPETLLTYSTTEEGTCLPSGECEYVYTTQVCEGGCIEDEGRCVLVEDTDVINPQG